MLVSASWTHIVPAVHAKIGRWVRIVIGIAALVADIRDARNGRRVLSDFVSVLAGEMVVQRTIAHCSEINYNEHSE